MKSSQLIIAINGLIDARQPGFVWGSPGIGKSSIMKQICEMRSTPKKPFELRDVRLGQMDPTDIKGFPAPDLKTGTMRWLPPNFLPTSGQGLLFLDEMNTSPPAVQASGYQLMLDRRVGDYVLPDGWAIMAAGNNESDRAVTHRMSTALANRLVHLYLTVDLEEWCHWAQDHDIHEHRVAFLRFRGKLLHDFKADAKLHAFPSPRSWAFADKICRQGLPRAIERQLMDGTVGEGAAAEYDAFIQVIKELPTLDEIKVDPEGATLPKSPAAQHAISTTLAMATTDDSSYSTFMEYMKRLPKEFQVVYTRDVLRTVNKIKFTSAFKTWSVDNADVLL